MGIYRTEREACSHNPVSYTHLDVGFFGLGEVAVALQDESVSVPTDDAVQDDAFRQVACKYGDARLQLFCGELAQCPPVTAVH